MTTVIGAPPNTFKEEPMREHQERKTDALRRVQGFVNTYAGVLGPIAALDGRTEVDAALLAIDTLTSTQAIADRYLAGELNRQVMLIQQLVREHLVPVARFARVKLGNTPDLKALTPAIDQGRITRLLGQARATAIAVTKHNVAYTTGGFAVDQAEQITRLVEEIMKAQSERANLRGARVNATRGLAKEIARGLAGVKHLDAVIIQQFASNAGLLAEWKSISRVRAKTGVSRATPAAASSGLSSAPETAA
jgi:hypothetical protein